MNSRTLATVLAALRYYQGAGFADSADIPGPFHNRQSAPFIQAIANNGDTLLPLTAAEIDELCESLNVGHITLDADSGIRSALERVASLLPYDEEGEPMWNGDTQLTTRPDGEDAMRVLNFHIKNARKILKENPACHAPTGDSEDQDENAEAIRELAREKLPSDEDTIDEDAAISHGNDNGCYVAAWLWVDFSGTPFDKKTA